MQSHNNTLLKALHRSAHYYAPWFSSETLALYKSLTYLFIYYLV